MAGCNSCAQRAAGAQVVEFKVVGSDGKPIGTPHPTRTAAVDVQRNNPGSRVVPVTAAEKASKPGPATNSQAKRA